MVINILNSRMGLVRELWSTSLLKNLERCLMCLSTETKDHLKPVTKVFLFIFFFFFIMENMSERVILPQSTQTKKISTIVKVMIIVTRHNGNIQKFFLTSKPMGLRRNAGYITLHNIYSDRTCRINKYFCKIHSAWA